MIDFNIPSKGLYIEKQMIYNINIPLRDEIQNGSFKKDWLLKLNYEYFEQLEKILKKLSLETIDIKFIHILEDL